MATTWTLRVALDGGAAASGGVIAQPNQSALLSLDNTIGLTSYLWQIYDFPEGFACPAGWTDNVDSAGVHDYRYTGTTPPAFTLSASLWGKYGLRFTGNNGKSTIQVGKTEMLVDDPNAIDIATSISVPHASGIRGLMSLERNQFAAEHSPPRADFIAELRHDLEIIASQLITSGTVNTTGAGTDTPAELDTTNFGAEAIIEVAATFYAIKVGGGAVKARFKRTRTFGRAGNVLSALQAIETIGTDYNNLAGGGGSVDIDFSGDSISFEVTGDGTNALTWWVEYSYSVRALS